MKPETPLSNLTPEQLTARPDSNVERVSIIGNNEAGVENGAEAYEQKSEISAIMADIGATTSTGPSVPIVDQQAVGGGAIIAGNPAVANDDDLIEKEWVDRAKKIVAETKDNPYQRDEEVSRLQVDYLKKRFGRELGVAE